MIRKLKLKLISVNMFLVSLVLISAFTGMFLITKRNLEDRCRLTMHEISKAYTFKDNNILNLRDYSYLSAFVIETDDIDLAFTFNGHKVPNDEISENEIRYLESIISKVYLSRTDEGVLCEENLRFYSIRTERGHRIVFLDKEFEDSTLLDLMVIFIITGALTLALVLIISIIFAGISVEPVETSMAQQRQLVADLSHELKTPITVISANADIISSHAESTVAEQQKWINYIKTETSRMSSLISSMLFLAKNDEDAYRVKHDTVNLTDVTYAAALPFESVCFERNKSIDINAEENICVKGDESQLKQLIAVLVDNACKYSSENGKIKVMLKSDADKAILSVWNTGDPIPAEHLAHLFDRFYRVDKSRSRSEGGSGLGLSIAKTIADNHQAKISVISSSENGTQFFCTFKRVK